MLDFVIFAVTFVVSLLIVVIYLLPGSPRPSSIPGPEPTSQEDGNLLDIDKAGSLHEFLMATHEKYGPIASFWIRKQFVTSIASPELFKEHLNVFDVPPELFESIEFTLNTNCLHYTNKQEGRNRRSHYGQAFTYDAIKKYYETFQQVSDDLVEKISSLVEEEHVALSQYMNEFAVKIALVCLMGDRFRNDQDVLEFRRLYGIIFSGSFKDLKDLPDAENPRMKTLEQAKIKLLNIIGQTIEQRRNNPPKKKGEELLIDLLIEYWEDDEMTKIESLMFLAGGNHTTANLLTWLFHFLATHQNIQEKVFKEIKDVLGKNKVDHNTINNLVYTRQVIDETLRCSVIAPFCTRVQDFDSEIGGYKIPKNTPVIHALGVSYQDERIWEDPTRFNPDRFSSENKMKRHSLAFKPFGFAGKRICPAYRFAYAEVTVLIVTLLQKFKFNMVEGQVITPIYGFVTSPSEEVWVTIEKR